jgi:tetraacyldisaccharide 4'-kinase
MGRRRVSPAGRIRDWIPRWWRGETGPAGEVLRALLAPVEALFATSVAARNTLYDRGVLRPRRASVPVLSVGNLSVGGTGKTPFVAWMASWLEGRGNRPAIVARGYGRDELLLHRLLNPQVPVFATPRRIQGVEIAAAEGRRCALLDDGFQHRRLARDLDIVLIAAESWPRPRRLLPRGAWRERPGALARADLVVVTRKTASPDHAAEVAESARVFAPGRPVAICAILPTRLVQLSDPSSVYPLEWLEGREVLAVSTLAEPDAFHQQLSSAGALVTERRFPDHFEFDPSEALEIQRDAEERVMVMTWKEGVKLRTLLPRDARALVLEQEVSFDEGRDDVENLVSAVLEGSR